MPIRAVSLPVNSCLDLPWADFCKRLHACLEQSTALANWTARELDRRDVVRLPGVKKLPSMPAIPRTRKGGKWLRGLYGLASVQFDFCGGFWKGAAICASSIIRAVERKYRKERKAIVWEGRRLPARYRYPVPFPVHANCWDGEFRDGRPVLTVRLPGGPVELSLRGGPEFARQLADFRRVVKGEAKKCQLLLTFLSSGGSHRQTTDAKGSSYRIMVKLIVDVPEHETSGGRVLALATDPAALWVAELDGRRAWVLNADHVKRACDWQESHRVRLQRWAEDTKAERRGSPRKRKQFEASRQRCCLKHARRLKTWCQQSAAHLTQFAVRQRVGTVAYSDLAREYLPGFPWHLLKSCLQNALAAVGVELVAVPE